MKTIEISDETFAKLDTARRLREEWHAVKRNTDALQTKCIELHAVRQAVWLRYLKGEATAAEYCEAQRATVHASDALVVASASADSANRARRDAIEAIALDLFPPLP